MCLRPLDIQNNSVYYSNEYSFSHYAVPCGKCLECRNEYQSEWQTRVSFELSALYRRGGVAVFLTFTYNNKCLPRFRYCDEYGYELINVSCFNHSDVTTFLNRVKVLSYRAFGPAAYKYFITSEYGKNTKRPHYHGLFFLQPGVDYTKFVELCRSAWTYGFMFPKFDVNLGYVDNDYHSSTPLIRSLTGGAKYVSKYVTKDLSFYEIPQVDSFLQTPNGFLMKKYLPKHWQSNLLGLSILDEVNLMDENSVMRLLRVGVMNPLTFKVVPCPKFIINKLMYKNVFTGRYNEDGKKLYDRFLSNFGTLYMRQIFLSRLDKFAIKMYETFTKYKDKLSELGLPEHAFIRMRSLMDVLSPTVFYERLSLYHLFWKNVNIDVFYNTLQTLDGSLTDLWRKDVVFPRWYHAKDSRFIMFHPSVFATDSRIDDNLTNVYLSTFKWYEFYDKLFSFISIYDSNNRLKELEKRSSELDELRKYFFKYDKELC